MARQEQDPIEQSRGAVLDLLLDKVAEDRYPSATIMDQIEELMTPDELPAYVAVLMSKVKEDQYPSMSMIHRLVRVTS